MNAFRQTILVLGCAIILLGVPATALAGSDDAQDPEAITMAAGPGAISTRARDAIRPRVFLPDTVVVVSRPGLFGDATKSPSNFVSRGGRSNLRPLCLLRC